MFILNNNCYFYGETALCGTRGWFYEQEQEGTHDEKIFRRELGRLEASLKAAGDHEKLCFLHYPPRYRGYECRRFSGCWRATGSGSAFTGICTPRACVLRFREASAAASSDCSPQIM